MPVEIGQVHRWKKKEYSCREPEQIHGLLFQLTSGVGEVRKDKNFHQITKTDKTQSPDYFYVMQENPLEIQDFQLVPEPSLLLIRGQPKPDVVLGPLVQNLQ